MKEINDDTPDCSYACYLNFGAIQMIKQTEHTKKSKSEIGLKTMKKKKH